MFLLVEHTGEEWFRFGWQEYAAAAVVALVFLALLWAGRLPSMTSFKDFADTINSAGGHIIVLSLFSAYFFRTAMRFFFHVLGLPDEVITKHDAIIMTGVGFLTGTAFGGAWGALIKTMSGGKANGGPTEAEADQLRVGFVPANGEKKPS